MNRFLPILLLSFFAFSIISCSSDDDASASDDIVGTWEYNRGGAIVNGEEILMPWEHLCPSKKDKLEILNNNVIKAYDYEEDCELFYGEGTWSYSGNTFKVTVDGTTGEWEVISLTNTTLKFKVPEPRHDYGHVLVEFKRI